jgi:two-component system chemotaxis response regulator CheB
VVVVGSQGALDSFRTTLSAIGPNFPAALIFDLHRSDQFGITEEVLRRRSGLPVELAREGTAPQPGQVYLAPHDRQLVISDERRFKVLEPADGVGHRFADDLLASAARAFGPRLIAIVLSGRLDGGARGVREVKRRGGRVFVQHPDSAVAPSMPTAALATGCVDFALTPERIGEALVVFCAAAGGAELFRVRVNAAVAS